MNAPDTAFPAQDIPTTIGIAFEGGFYAGRIRIDDALFALVLSPAAGEIKPMLWAPARRKVDGARRPADSDRRAGGMMPATPERIIPLDWPSQNTIGKIH